MKLFNFSFTNEENIIFLLLILIIIILIVKSINKTTKNNNNNNYNDNNNNNVWLPYEQFEPVDQLEQSDLSEQLVQDNQLELIFPGRSFEAPIIEEPHVINQLKSQQKQVNELESQQKQVNELESQQKLVNELLKQQIPISSLNNEQILMMSQEPSYNFLPFIQKLLNSSDNTNTVSQEVVQQPVQEVVQKPVQKSVQQSVQQPVQNVNTISQEVEGNYAGFNEIDYTNVEQTQIPVEQKATSFNYIKSIEQVNSNDILDTYSSF